VAAGHTHVSYTKIWIILMVLLCVSMLGPLVGLPWLTLMTAFGIAVVKALFVAAHFMHLNIEKKFVWYILLVCLSFLLLLFFFVAPDVMMEQGRHWQMLKHD